MCGNYLVPFAPRGVNPREPSAQSNMPGELRNALAHGPQSPGSESQQQIQTLHEEHARHPWRHEGGPPACAQPGQFSPAPRFKFATRLGVHATRPAAANADPPRRAHAARRHPSQWRHAAGPRAHNRAESHFKFATALLPSSSGAPLLLQQQFPSPLSFCVDSRGN